MGARIVSSANTGNRLTLDPFDNMSMYCEWLEIDINNYRALASILRVGGSIDMTSGEELGVSNCIFHHNTASNQEH